MKYLLEANDNIYEYKKEIDILNSIDNLKQILIDKKENNMIFCISSKKNKTIMYSLVNEKYDSKEEVLKAILTYKKHGVTAFPIL